MRSFNSVFIAVFLVTFKVIPGTSTTNAEDGLSSPTLAVRSITLETTPCKQEITAVGNGVRDKFVKPCAQNVVDSVNYNSVMVFGDPKKVPFSLFSEKQGTLVVVENNRCTLKKYKTKKGKTTSTPTTLSNRKCLQIINKMSNALNSRTNNVLQQTSQPVKVLTKPPVSPLAPVTPSIQNIVQPQPYPEQPQSTQDILLPQPISASDSPTPASTPIDNSGFDQSTTSPTITYLPADNHVNDQYFTRNNNIYNNDGHYIQELMVVGRGVNDRIRYPSETNKPPKSMSFSNILSVNDPNGYFKLFTNRWGVLWVLVNGQYFERTYETANGQTKITSTPITAAEYEDAKNKAANLPGGGTITNFGNTYTM